MKQYLTATAALLALGVQAQVSGPNRPGPGTSPGTFQTPGATESSIQTTTPSTINPTTTDTANISVAPPVANPRTGPLPRTSLGTPDPRGGALSDSLRSRSSFPSSRDWETGPAAGSAAANQSESRRLTPIPDAARPDITPDLPTIQGAGSRVRGTGTTIPSSTVSGVAPTSPVRPMPSDLNTTGVNTPPRQNEQPLDKALSAKIRAQLSQTPVKGMSRLAPETIRDLRITSQGGKVILEGNVRTEAEKKLAEAQARQVPGVVAVENNIDINNRAATGAAATEQTGQSRQNSVEIEAGGTSSSSDLK